MPSDTSQPSLDAVSVLAEPLRRALYRYVITQRHDVSRQEAAEAAGVQRNLAAFHLDKLVEAGLLEATFRRVNDRSGPGAGRPAKLYRRASTDHSVSLPPRAYPVAAELLAEVVEGAGADAALQAAARRAGRTFGQRAASAEHEPSARSDCAAALPDGFSQGESGDLSAKLAAVLTSYGFEPFREEGKVRLHNCPFHLLSRQYPPLICGMNLALVEGIIDGLGGPDGLAHIDPAPDRCCVAVDELASLSDLPVSNTYVD